MNIIKSNNSKNVVSLDELVPQHDCLKLLILHTPYTLKIDSLHLCINLVKLDLSKNNLQTFPYLGNLVSLKFMFIHENKLDIAQLKGIFEAEEGQKSRLSENIIWVTFWGNKHSFLARHFLVNSTNAIAVDKNMIVFEERTESIEENSVTAFSKISDIAQLLEKKQVINRHASEDEYMKELWKQMSFLRKKQQQLYPIIKIQKVFRGWIQRVKQKRKVIAAKNYKCTLQTFFYQWKDLTIKNSKLAKILKSSGKEHYLLSIKQMKRRQIQLKMIQLAKKAKQKVLLRKIGLKAQYKFYAALTKNMYVMRSLYTSVQLKFSKSIYVHRQSWEMFQKIIIPFAKLSNSPNEAITIKENANVRLRQIFDFFKPESKEFIKILQTQVKSKVFTINLQKKANNRRKKKNGLTDNKLKPIYLKLHFSTAQKNKMRSISANLDAAVRLNLSELVIVQGSERMLKDLVRGIYFYNTGVLTQQKPSSGERICFLSEAMIKKCAAAVRIQKIWRGYSFRKSNNPFIKNYLEMKKAAIIIQRWVRKYPNYYKNKFNHRLTNALKKINTNSFYIESSQYFQFIHSSKNLNGRLRFLQQNICPYINTQTDQLTIFWDKESDKREVTTNFHLKKVLFNRKFLRQILECTDAKINQKICCNQQSSQKSQINHLFHFQAQNNILSHGGKKYIQFSFKDKFQAKLRGMAVLLLTTTVKAQRFIKLRGFDEFLAHQKINKMPINDNPTSFITNQNVSMLKNCDKRLKSQKKVNYYVITNRIYLQDSQKKPIKIEEKLFIYLVNYPTDEKKDINNDIQVKNATKPTTKQFQIQSYFLTEHHSSNTGRVNAQSHLMTQNIIRPSQNIKIVVNKKSVKQFKVERKNKPKQQHSFMLDSVNINERLTTQPDVAQTVDKSSLRQNYSQKKLRENSSVSEARPQLKSTFEERYEAKQKRKEIDKFTKRFVNLNNFIQNQYASENKRRVTIESQHRALMSADKIKQSKEKYSTQKQNNLIQKHKKVRQHHSNHRQLLQKNQIMIKEHANRLKTEASIQREKRQMQKSKLKKLKVSFAQECFPLINKGRQPDQFY